MQLTNAWNSNEILRKHGILPPKPEAPRTPSPPPSPTLEQKYAKYSAAQLRELAAEAPDDETERILEVLRRRRLQEARKMEQARFGRVYPISRDDYTREVTEASKVNEEGDEQERGTGVVVFLYKDGYAWSDHAARAYVYSDFSCAGSRTATARRTS